MEREELSIYIRGGRDRQGLLTCIQSIDVQAEVLVGLANDTNFAHEIEQMGFPVVLHQYGNWSLASETGVKAARNNHIIMMDSDSTFAPGSIAEISTALRQGFPVVQPTVVFLDGSSPVSKVISKARTYENRNEPKAYSPGLGLNREKLLELIGVDGNIYNTNVFYGDDGVLDHKLKDRGVSVHVAQKAVIYHSPITFKHELQTTFRFGRGEFQLNGLSTGLLDQIVSGFFSSDMRDYINGAGKDYGKDTALFLHFMKLVYIAGFGYEKFKGNK